jgi:hypothetical protein
MEKTERQDVETLGEDRPHSWHKHLAARSGK